jgi:hypothetical protein
MTLVSMIIDNAGPRIRDETQPAAGFEATRTELAWTHVEARMQNATCYRVIAEVSLSHPNNLSLGA